MASNSACRCRVNGCSSATYYRPSDQQVLTVGTVTTLIRGDVYAWGMLMAGALVAAAPPLVIYAFLMDYYIAGLTAGATKG